jgi:hypothetical protein
MKTTFARYQLILYVVIGICAFVILSLSLQHPRPAYSQSGTSIIGYAWSDNIGWIDMNCLNTSSCGVNPFGIAIDSSGNLSGYAWSDNVGWVSANSTDLTGCPSGPCTATITGATVSGWMRAMAGGTAQSGGWDGFISLSNITYNLGTNFFSGYAWGDTVVGWIDFGQVRKICPISYGCSGNQITQTTILCQVNTYSPPCTAYASFCSSGSSICLYPQPAGYLIVSPKLQIPNKTVTVAWSMTGVATSTAPACTVVSNNGDSWSGASSTRTSVPVTSETTFTLSCTPLDPGLPNPYRLTAVVKMVPTYQER